MIQEAAPDPFIMNEMPIKKRPTIRAVTYSTVSDFIAERIDAYVQFGADTDMADPTKEMNDPINNPRLRPNLSRIGSATGRPTIHPMLMMATRSPILVESSLKSGKG